MMKKKKKRNKKITQIHVCFCEHILILKKYETEEEERTRG
jgi:hypothetical protein